ncbi:MAG: hypothetical protein KME23_08435 [Goleter apudmare HA4340-LM2]|jgi:hypothetical protein|nr:hypothetical protein [Goleter apudmare HA4340-LM2]
MAEIKRLNYFTSQFLIEDDFQDEQAYHRELRHRHNQLLHSWGVVEGLIVSKTGDKQVTISSGVAINKDGKEIILPSEPPPPPLNLSGTGDVLVTIEYQDVTDEKDKDTTSGVVNQFRRITERPLIKSTNSQPANDGAVILLARVRLDTNGNIEGTPDNTVRTLVSATISPGAVSTTQLANNSVNAAKIVDSAVGTSKIANGAVTVDKLANNSVNAAKIIDGSVATAELADNAVTTNKIVDNAVTINKIADNSINAAKIIDGSVGTAELANLAVTVDKILNGTITAAKIAPGVIPANIGIAVNPTLQNGQTIPPPNGFAVNECVFFAFAKSFTVPAGGGGFSVFADATGKITASAPTNGSILVVGVAIAKKGGWAN